MKRITEKVTPNIMAEYMPALLKIEYQANEVNDHIDSQLELLLGNMGYKLSGSGFDSETSIRNLSFMLVGEPSVSANSTYTTTMITNILPRSRENSWRRAVWT